LDKTLNQSKDKQNGTAHNRPVSLFHELMIYGAGYQTLFHAGKIHTEGPSLLAVHP
jgi:hypothetical protein